MVWISYSLETDIPVGLERHWTLSLQVVSLPTSSPCVQGDLLKTLSTHELISSLPRHFIHLYKDNWKEGESFFGTERILKFYVCIKPFFFYWFDTGRQLWSGYITSLSAVLVELHNSLVNLNLKLGVVAHKILVSAQGPLVFGIWVCGLGVWGLGLTISIMPVSPSF